MRIAYLLGDTGISATARIVLAQADALIAKDHQVRIVTTGLPLTWRSSLAEWVYVDDLRAFVPDAGEIVVDPKVVQVNPIVDDDFYRDRLPRENEPLRVLLCGGSPSINEGYGAAAHARWFHQKFDLIRVSPWAPSREEPLDGVQEFHVALNDKEMTRLMHSCDVLLAPNRREDPQSLTTLEALASGLACVVTSTAPHLAYGEPADYALFAPPDNAVELGEKLIEALSSPALRQRLRARGREVAEQWRSVNVVVRLEKLLTS
ncbi:MAG TPA: glycosyltransferase family 4 protein [Thermoanaerobaculia bacterium]|jgi:glycosyltransferase involved in cell wall biosynthesis|nr:glycosyltransferase family 4 protein [Thermoanaerobaculia bacterium]